MLLKVTFYVVESDVQGSIIKGATVIVSLRRVF